MCVLDMIDTYTFAESSHTAARVCMDPALAQGRDKAKSMCALTASGRA